MPLKNIWFIIAYDECSYDIVNIFKISCKLVSLIILFYSKNRVKVKFFFRAVHKRQSTFVFMTHCALWGSSMN